MFNKLILFLVYINFNPVKILTTFQITFLYDIINPIHVRTNILLNPINYIFIITILLLSTYCTDYIYYNTHTKYHPK
jgi:hypothetical protein